MSHIFAYYGAQDAVTYIDSQLQNTIRSTPTTLEQTTALPEFLTPDCIDPNDDSTFVFHFNPKTCLGDAAAPLYTVSYDPETNKPVHIPVPYMMHYNCCGKELANISRSEYYALIKIQCFNQEKNNTNLTITQTANGKIPKGTTGRLKSRAF